MTKELPDAEFREELARLLFSPDFVPFAGKFDEHLALAGFRRPADMAWSKWLADVIYRGLTDERTPLRGKP